nr:MAG TPA: capsid protein [Cressdnaviricota sp.]
MKRQRTSLPKPPAKKIRAAAAVIAQANPPPKAKSSRSGSGRGNTSQIPRGFVGLAGDRKFVDTAEATYACNTTGSITHVSIVPTGTTVNTRDGKAFRVTSVQIRGAASVDTTTTVALANFAFVWDYQPNKALPGLTDIWDTIDGSTMIKRENNARFKIAMWRHWTLTGNTTAPATGREAESIDEFIKLPKDAIALCTSADTTGVIGNRINGALYYCTFGNVAAGTADAVTIVKIRTNFIEI